ncbi:MAG: peptide chain release factor N(5)-glutamine methyltransferase [Candidatus Acetothermia bacterium]
MSKDWTVKTVLEWTREYFRDAGINKARLEAEILLAHSLDVDRLDLYLEPDRPLTQEELDQFKPLIKQRREGTPIEYVIGKVNFMGLTLKIDKRGLIPRPETEELVEQVLSAHRPQKDLKVLDLGTGSGAIAIALAKFLVNPSITAVDIDPDTLSLAKDNAQLNSAADRITFLQSDWFAGVEGSFDLIVTNPPYVSARELEDLDPKIKDHEPLQALDGGRDGLESIDRIVRNSHKFVNESGYLYIEIGANQGRDVKRILRECDYSKVQLREDLAGRDRIVTATNPRG